MGDIDKMGGLFSKPKSVKPPPIAPPPPTPEVGPETEDFAMKQAKSAQGFEKNAFLTGDLVPDTGKKKFLGGNKT